MDPFSVSYRNVIPTYTAEQGVGRTADGETATSRCLKPTSSDISRMESKKRSSAEAKESGARNLQFDTVRIDYHE